METPFSDIGSPSSVVDTPTSAVSLSHRLEVIATLQAPVSLSESSSGGGVNTPDTAQSAANKLKENVPSAAAYMTSTFAWQYGKKQKHDYIIAVGSKPEYCILSKSCIRKQRKMYEKVFGQDVLANFLKDPSKYPAAVLPSDDPNAFGMFMGWTCVYRSARLDMTNLFDMQSCTREERLHTINTLLGLIFFADKYSLDEFQDEVLRLLIETTKEDKSPLGIYHVRQVHENTSMKSKARRFMIDFVAYIVQELDGVFQTSVNCDLAQASERLLVDLLDLLEGGEIRDSDGEVSDPREATNCVYHQHNSDEKCPHESFDFFVDNMSSLTLVDSAVSNV